MGIKQVIIGFGDDGAGVRIVNVDEENGEALTREFNIPKNPAGGKKREELLKLLREVL